VRSSLIAVSVYADYAELGEESLDSQQLATQEEVQIDAQGESREGTNHSFGQAASLRRR